MTIKLYKKQDCWYFKYKTIEYHILCDDAINKLSNFLDKENSIYLKIEFSEHPHGLSLIRLGTNSFWPNFMLKRLLELSGVFVTEIEIWENFQELPFFEKYSYIDILDIF